MTHPSWAALRDMIHSFIELDKAVVHVIRLVSFRDCGFHSVREGNGTPLQYSCLENPWTEEPGRLQSMGSLRVGQD